MKITKVNLERLCDTCPMNQMCNKNETTAPCKRIESIIVSGNKINTMEDANFILIDLLSMDMEEVREDYGWTTDDAVMELANNHYMDFVIEVEIKDFTVKQNSDKTFTIFRADKTGTYNRIGKTNFLGTAEEYETALNRR